MPPWWTLTRTPGGDVDAAARGVDAGVGAPVAEGDLGGLDGLGHGDEAAGVGGLEDQDHGAGSFRRRIEMVVVDCATNR